RCRETSKRVTGRKATRPWRKPAALLFQPEPNAVTMPVPVMTTRAGAFVFVRGGNTDQFRAPPLHPTNRSRPLRFFRRRKRLRRMPKLAIFAFMSVNTCPRIMRMKTCNTILNRIALSVALSWALPWIASANEMTAFELISEGNRYVGEQAKDKVVQIRSEKSIGGLTPNIWFVVYYDPTANLKATEVKFGAGKM